jgi:O-antigen/teichoic acid export membrane protein
MLAGSVSGMAQVLINSLLILAIVPLAIKALGVEWFGVFTLLSLISNLGAVANLGLNGSLVKYLSEQGRCTESNRDIVVGFLLLSTAVVVLSLFALCAEGFTMNLILQIPSSHTTVATRWCFRWMVFANAFVLLGQIPSAVLDALGLVYLTNWFQVLFAVLNKGVLIVVLLVSPTFELLGASMFFSTIVWLLYLSIVAKRRWGTLALTPRTMLLKQTVTKHLSYGGRIYLAGLLGLVFEPMNKVLIARFLGLPFVVSFDVALRVKSFLVSMLERLLYPLLPKMASIVDFDRVKKMVEDVQRISSPLLVTIGIAIIWLARPIAEVWVGVMIDQNTEAIAVVSSAYLIALLFLPFYQFLTVKGHPGKTALLQLANVVVNCSAFMVLVPLFHFRGALMAFGLALVNSFFWCALLQVRILKKPSFVNSRYVFSLIAMAIVLACVDYSIAQLVSHQFTMIVCTLITNAGVLWISLRRFAILGLDDLDRLFLGNNFLHGVARTAFIITRSRRQNSDS